MITLVEAFNLVALIAIISIPFLKVKGNGIIAIVTIGVQVVLASIISVYVFLGYPVDYSYAGSFVTGQIPIRIDYLSAWFILIISFTFITGAIYGLQYLKKYSEQRANLALHSISFIIAFTSLIDICIIQNSLVFLVVWELMALSSFMLIIFEHNKKDTIKAGINFLIQSHFCILFLTLGFMWVRIQTGTFDFKGITEYTSTSPALVGVGLFTFFFFGFAIKAGFVPFHTWLPLAHPAAPAHVSGVMSGVIIKIGIYGIFRMLLLIKSNFITIGYLILIISVITGVYGVMLAIIQHNLKKLLAYHSIENIGIIGIGIGLGCLGIGYNNQLLILLGFSGALLHTLNHSLFKSLLFYSTGTVYQHAHSINIEALGGLIKKIPHTAILFLIGSLAICGLPPFNGFVSEFFIYLGMFKSLNTADFSVTVLMMFSILGLVLIGGLAMICFTKAFSIVFLGTPRHIDIENVEKDKKTAVYPLYLIVGLILAIGLLPSFFVRVVSLPVSQFTTGYNANSVEVFDGFVRTSSLVGAFAAILIALAASIYFLRRYFNRKSKIEIAPTWGCGYTGSANKMQYTASSFIRSYRKLVEPLLKIRKFKTDAQGIFPNQAHHETHPYDKVEHWLIDKPIGVIRRILSRFTFLQSGNVQSYILYGFIFITLIILIPEIYQKILMLIKFLNQL